MSYRRGSNTLVQPRQLVTKTESTNKHSQAVPRRVLSLFDAVCIIVGTIIGAGIFKTVPEVAKNAGDFQWMIMLWVFGGVLTVIGAMCFAELTTTHSEDVGGDYVYLKKAYGRPVGFMFAWAAFWIIRPANIGAMAITFASYFDQIVPTGHQVVYAIVPVVLLSITNLIGLRQGTWIQNVLTVAKVLGILAIVGLAFFNPVETATWKNPSPPENAAGGWLLAMVLIMFTFGGWNDISFVAAEIKQPGRNLFRSLIFGSLIVTAVYIAMSFAAVAALGFESLVEAKAYAVDVVRSSLGDGNAWAAQSARLVAALVCVSCLGAINGIMLTSPRIYYAAGRDYQALDQLGRWDARRDQPWQATVAQAVVTVLLFSLCFRYENPFSVIVQVSAPVFWSFLGVTGLALIVLRYKNRSGVEPEFAYRVPFYPLPPIVLAIVCFAMTYSSISWVIKQEFWVSGGLVAGLMAVGILVGLFLKPRENIESKRL